MATAISSLNRLTHRGAIAADGCGLLHKQPTEFLRAVARAASFKLGALFAAGLVFLDRDTDVAGRARDELTRQPECEGLKVAGFRALPTAADACGTEALKTLPVTEQLFVNAPRDIDDATFNRKALPGAPTCRESTRDHRSGVLYALAFL